MEDDILELVGAAHLVFKRNVAVGMAFATDDIGGEQLMNEPAVIVVGKREEELPVLTRPALVDTRTADGIEEGVGASKIRYA